MPAPTPAPPRTDRLVVEHVTKRFGSTLALDDVSVRMRAGEVHALMGENGAGKSTLGKAIAGVHTPDPPAPGRPPTRIMLDGEPLPTGSVHAASARGVRIVHQELAQCPNLTVAENLCLHAFPTRRGPVSAMLGAVGLGMLATVDRDAARTRARRLLADLDPSINPDAPLGTLAPGRRQIVQIAAALDEAEAPAKVIVFDEPTSSLSVVEAQRLIEIVRGLAARGILCIYVSHRMNEIFSCADRVTVLRDGRFVGTGVIARAPSAAGPASATESATVAEPVVDESRLVTWMIGREAPAGKATEASRAAPAGAAPAAPPRLRVRGLASPGRLEAITLEVRAGEIVGVGGLVGAGRSELLDAVFGLDPRASGVVEVDGRALVRLAPREAIAAGIGYVPEDRRLQGLFFLLGVDENVVMPVMPDLATAGFRAPSRERAVFRAGVDRFRIKTASPSSTPGELSGGNQQKLLLARWMREGTRVLLLDEPTRGIDVGTKAEIHRLIAQAADAGAAVLLVSSEMPELLSLSDRVVVLADGRIAGEVSGSAMSPEGVLRLAVRSRGTKEPAGSSLPAGA